MSLATKRSDTHPEKFLHAGAIGLPDITHVTVFARNENDGMWYGSVAFCHKSDQFSRAKGRTVARRRYFKGERVFIGHRAPDFYTLVDTARFMADNRFAG